MRLAPRRTVRRGRGWQLPPRAAGAVPSRCAQKMEKSRSAEGEEGLPRQEACRCPSARCQHPQRPPALPPGNMSSDNQRPTRRRRARAAERKDLQTAVVGKKDPARKGRRGRKQEAGRSFCAQARSRRQ